MGFTPLWKSSLRELRINVTLLSHVCGLPPQITAIEPLVSYGGASTSTQHLHQSLRWFFGVAAVVTDVGHVLLVDLCLDDLSCSQSELEASGQYSFHRDAHKLCSVHSVAERNQFKPVPAPIVQLQH